MKWRPLPIVGGSYRDDTRPWSTQDTINFIPVMAEKGGTRSPSMLRGAPGFNLFCDTGGGPIRKLHNVEGTLFAVSGGSLLRVDVDATVSASLGTVPGVGRTPMAHNQVAGGNQLVIAANNAGYYYDTSSSTFGQITDEGFPGAVSFDYINQFIVGIDPSRNFAFTSDLADALSYNTLDRVQAESQPDKLVGQIVTHGEWWLFGERTIQPFQDTGAGTGTFQAAQNEIMEVGCASGQTICRMDNSVFWLGNDGIVYRANGYTPQRISDHPLEQAIARCNWAQAFAFTFEDRGHKIYYLTFPDGETWGYDAASQEWHRRKSYGLDRWRISDVVFWNGGWYAGDYANGKIYRLDWDAMHENGAVLERRRILPVIADDQNAFIVNALELVVDTGNARGYDRATGGLLRIKGDMPNGGTGDVVSTAYVATGGVAPFTYSVDSGALPPGVTLDTATGVASGTYTTVGSYSWVIKVVDALGSEAAVSDRASVKQSYLVAASNSHITYSTTGTSGWVLPTTGNPNGDYVAFGNGVFVAGQHNDLLFVSSNLADWTSHAAPGSSMGGLAFGNGRFVTGTTPGGLDAGHLYSSTNGIDWAALTHPGIQSVTSIAYLNGLFVVTCFAGGVLTSPDGETWTKYTLGSNQMRAATVSDAGVYMVAGNNGATYTSPDGKTWTLKSTQFSGAASIAHLAFFAGKYIAQLNTADLYSSSDGVLWTALTPPATPNGALAVYQGKLFEGYTANVEYTSDLATWTQVSNAASSNTTQFCSGTV